MSDKKQNLVCCPIGGEPQLFSDYTPQGNNIILSDLPVYTIGTGPKVIVVAHDIYGFDGGRTKLICDQLANEGYRIYLPDFYRGKMLDPYDKATTTQVLAEFVQKYSMNKIH